MSIGRTAPRTEAKLFCECHLPQFAEGDISQWESGNRIPSGWPVSRRKRHAGQVVADARAPSMIWQVDMTVVRLIDGTRTYLHAVIDNFSRMVLAWKVSERFEPANTVANIPQRPPPEPGGSLLWRTSA
jgi:transposase InsO family protein